MTSFDPEIILQIHSKSCTACRTGDGSDERNGMSIFILVHESFACLLPKFNLLPNEQMPMEMVDQETGEVTKV